VRRLKILYLGPRGLSGGIGGSARLRNMLDVLAGMQAQTRLVSYLPEKRFGAASRVISEHLSSSVVSVPAAAPRLLKFPALKLLFYYGLKYAGKSDFILAHSPGTVYGLPALFLAKLFRKPLVIDLTDTRDPSTPAFLYRYVLRHADLVLAVSHLLTDLARQAGCPRVVHAPGFISTEMFRSDPAARQRIRRELKLENSDIVVGYAGAFSRDEGLTYLIRAVKMLAPRYDNLRLVMLGGRNRPGADEIPRLVAELGLESRVTLLPPQPYETVPAYLSAFDIGCSPKIDIELNRAADPIRVYEYMAAGLPAVASAVGETAHAIEHGVDGFLVKPEDAAELAGVLEHVIQNLGSLDTLREKAREKVIRDYSQAAMRQKLQKHLAELLPD